MEIEGTHLKLSYDVIFILVFTLVLVNLFINFEE